MVTVLQGTLPIFSFFCWASSFAAHARISQLLVACVIVGLTGIAIDLRHDGIKSQVWQMMAPQMGKDAA